MSLGLITDRTAADLSNLKELRTKIMNRTATADEWTEWLADMKAAYNYTDLNRVNTAMDTIVTALNAAPATLEAYIASIGVAPDEFWDLGYTYPISITTKTNWTNTDNVQETDMDTYINNVSTLHDAIELPSGTPSVPSSMNALTYMGANAIENILETVYSALAELLAEKETFADNTAASWVYCGQPPCGLVNTQFS